MNQPDRDATVFARISRPVNRRALREFGGDPSQARARDAEVVKKYTG